MCKYNSANDCTELLSYEGVEWYFNRRELIKCSAIFNKQNIIKCLNDNKNQLIAFKMKVFIHS